MILLANYGIKDLRENKIHVLSKKELLPRTKDIPRKTCIHCLAGKQDRVVFGFKAFSRK